MPDLVTALVGPIAKVLLKSWLGDVGSEMAWGLVEIAKQRFDDRRQAAEAQRKATVVARSVVADLERILKAEGDDADELEAAAHELGVTIERHVEASFLVRQNLADEAIAAGLLKARPPERIFKPGEPAHGFYRQLVEALAPRLRAVAPELPDYGPARDAELLVRLDRLAAEAPGLLEAVREVGRKVEEIADRPRRLAEGFERNYLDALVKELDYVEILGIEELDQKSRRADLSIAYLSLMAQLGLKGETRRIDFAALLTLLPELGNRVLVLGPAGSGKTTLTRWAVIEAARWRLGTTKDEDVLAIAPDLDSWLEFLHPRGPDDEMRVGEKIGRVLEHPRKGGLRMEAWRARLPFLVPLRHNEALQSLEALPGIALRTIPKVPDGWLQDVFAGDGAGVLLIFDGADEVPAGERRHDVLRQIEDYAERFPKAQILVTARPNAVAQDILEGFTRVGLDDLDPEQKRCFVEHWHRAFAANFKRAADDPVVQDLQAAVLRELERQPALDRLAANPLLCAAVCALHWLQRRHQVTEGWQRPEAFAGFEGTVLPGNVWSLCEQLTRMLVHQRDLDRRLHGKSFGPAYELTYELKREILARIAYGMVAGDLLSAMSHDDALEKISEAVVGSREQVNVPAPAILRALLERSGVLRGSRIDAIEFVHNTIKAFLAAKFYLGLNVPDDLARRIVRGAKGRALRLGPSEA